MRSEGGGGGAELVVDASVVKWYVLEPDREEALRIREDYIDGQVELAAPALMPFEVLNAVRYSADQLEVERLMDVAESLSLYGFRLYGLKGEYARLTARIALENNLTIYDASYVALAERLNTTLYTADERLIEALSGEYRGRVKLLSEYPHRRAS